ncbi:MAG: TIGR00730 family Rossman fold protein [Candidatus Jettenia sp.]|uniref:Cytokinin riboside 5'-monophosphate phosphoribohydrolase n=1 Tax=Candidatus Jettenia caeni TaxID=247490 RepID=I3IK31_9BACT|nr:TIGR00730 family Rossman fold protein [Candidatus Jettenia sp. AMX1]MBC6928995.1 TIGR00730 family Rossman fold protein [Candidatus Jettenia sp.]WKZ17337.1 MAG: TIGR00730 family Rossman fold protein [Candidatus Jettenia caeni]KAA0249224.1 MAG: TIGR00730 family Rossman fold protein [Candidatus Jettenia sp. AMX1]MCE7881100.1 TIGR00730 family Rossman fold protein [Candidatus Jettenia sp. AMX1]MCQ3927174.1 TIGR00730 family Rossman fold protein [Candidatus Jettenia sp.]
MSSKKKEKTKRKTKEASITPDHRIDKVIEGHVEETSSWRIFKIIGEFVSGYEFLRNYPLSASIFGSARRGFKDEIYKEARKLGYKLAKAGFAVITGGGPGVMEAANRGAYDAGGKSVGINIQLAVEQKTNPYVIESIAVNHFFIRKLMLSFASEVYIFFPGGFGTLDEFFELITLVQTKKSKPIPIILINREYWSPLLEWIENQIYKKNNAINPEDMHIYHLVNTADEAFQLIQNLTNSK